MPIWLRQTTFKFVQDSIQQEADAKNEAYKNSTGGKQSTTTTLDWANPDRSKLK